jgi:hypothetical protein
VFAKRILAPVLSIHGFSGSFKKELDLSQGGCRVVTTKIGKIYFTCSRFPSMLNMMENMMSMMVAAAVLVVDEPRHDAAGHGADGGTVR